MKKVNARSSEQRYEDLQSDLREVPWILNGSVNKIAPRADSSKARATYTWTRKVAGKTVTVALSKEQYHAFAKAIEANRRIEKTLKAMRKLSEQVLINTIPGVKKKPRSPTSKT